ncbi:MAG: GerMN domain-containing protein [Thermotaleaceae bacterium]
MVRAIFNLFLVVIICITASGIPVNVDAFDFSLPLPSMNTSISYVMDLETDTLENPSTIDLRVQGIPINELTYENDQRLQLEVFQDSQLIASFDEKTLVTSSNEVSSAVEDVLIYTLDISQAKLDLPNGSYVFHIRSMAKEAENLKPVELKVSYLTLSKYVPAAHILPKNMMALSLFFPDNNVQYLVPITRVVGHERAVLRKIIDELRGGPSEGLGLSALPIPQIKQLSVNRDLLTVNWTNDGSQASQGSSIAALTADSLVQSLTSISGISRIKFLVNGKDSDELFHGVGTREIFSGDIGPKVYLAYDNYDERMFLVPHSLVQKDRDALVQEIFNSLKTAQSSEGALLGLHPVIPSNVELLNTVYHNKTLTLNFDKDFLSIYPNRVDLQRMVVDSIFFSFTSLQDIDQVLLTVEGNAISSFGNINLSQPIKGPFYINPENE